MHNGINEIRLLGGLRLTGPPGPSRGHKAFGKRDLKSQRDRRKDTVSALSYTASEDNFGELELTFRMLEHLWCMRCCEEEIR